MDSNKEFDFENRNSADLLAWLNSQKNTIILPVHVQFEDKYKLAYDDVTLFGIKEEPILLRLDDSNMSLGLLFQIAAKCDKEASSCSIWLEGKWGKGPMHDTLIGVMDKEILGDKYDQYHYFQVRRIHDPSEVGEVRPKVFVK